MYIPRKTKRRVLILLTVLLAAAGVVATLWVLRNRRTERQGAQLRVEGMRLYEEGDYGKSVARLGQYLDKGKMQQKDPEALFAYGVSRKAVPMTRGKHL